MFSRQFDITNSDVHAQPIEHLLLKGNRLSGNLPTEIAAMTRLSKSQ
jgi:hypothetical protein